MNGDGADDGGTGGAAQTATAAAASIPAPPPPTVLNVNDNEGARFTVSLMLKRGGFRVIEARSGLEALEMMERLKPDAAVLDVRLPDIDGFEVCRRIRANPSLAATKVLCTSATFVTLERKVEGLGAGADGYLIQPFEHQELIATLRSLLRLAAAERELRTRADGLMEADRRKDEFLAMLAHELRNPLAAIAASLPQFDRRAAADANEQRARDVVKRQVQHLTRLVDDLLDVSRVTRGKIELRTEVVDLTALLDRVAQTIRERCVAPRQQEIDLSMPAPPILVRGDVTRLEQIFTNLFDNASKYTDSGGHIDVRLERVSDEAVTIRVRDDGIGIHRDNLSAIFGLFAQANVPIARSRGGLGIGLTLVRTLVEMHGGTIEAKSDGVGRGSEFVVTLPAIAAAAVAAMATETAAAQEAQDAHDAQDAQGAQSSEIPPLATPRAARVRRLLIIEDNSDAQQALRDLCEMWGHNVSCASDGLSGVDAALQLRPEVCLVDIGLPGIDGYEVARRIRREAAGDDIFLVALTGYGSPEQRRYALDAGFDLHLVKPVEPKALEEILVKRAVPGASASHVHARVPVSAMSGK